MFFFIAYKLVDYSIFVRRHKEREKVVVQQGWSRGEAEEEEEESEESNGVQAREVQ